MYTKCVFYVYVYSMLFIFDLLTNTMVTVDVSPLKIELIFPLIISSRSTIYDSLNGTTWDRSHYYVGET